MYVDFSDVKSSFEDVAPGKYPATVTKVEERVSQAGKPYIAWEFALTGGAYDGRRLWLNTSLSPKALWRLKKMLTDAFEVDATALTGNYELDPQEYVGRDVALIVKTGEYNGKTRSEVDSVINAASVTVDVPF